VVFAGDVVLVVADELVFVRQLEEDGEEAEELFNDLCVAFLIGLFLSARINPNPI
jgi:hypothetical protein